MLQLDPVTGSIELPIWASAALAAVLVVLVALALKRTGVPTELHIYAGVGHGFGIRPGNVGPAAAWPQQMLDWLDAQGFTKPR